MLRQLRARAALRRRGRRHPGVVGRVQALVGAPLPREPKAKRPKSRRRSGGRTAPLRAKLMAEGVRLRDREEVTVGRAHTEMSGYMAGDEVKIDPFEFLHEMNVGEVTATFVHEDGDREIELTGVPSDDPLPQEVRTSSGPRLFKYGTVEL